MKSVVAYGRALILIAFASLAPCTHAQNAVAKYSKERVAFKSGDLMLAGYLFKPEGAGPFAGLIWNHGSERDPGSSQQYDTVASVFAPAGYVVFAPVRRGHGGSEGTYIEDTLRNRGVARGAMQVDLLAGEQLDDQLAGLAYLKALPYVDTKRLVVAGCSYGGIQTLLAAERGAGYRAAFAISPAALSWNGNPMLQERLLQAARRTEIPVFLIQPPRDGSLEPARVLGAEFQRLGKRYTGKIYPADIPYNLQTHCFGGTRNGIHIWAQDALDFFAAAMR